MKTSGGKLKVKVTDEAIASALSVMFKAMIEDQVKDGKSRYAALWNAKDGIDRMLNRPHEAEAFIGAVREAMAQAISVNMGLSTFEIKPSLKPLFKTTPAQPLGGE